MELNDVVSLKYIVCYELQQHIKSVLKGFFSALKKRNEDISSIFITGVSKFHKVSIFSDLNQLRDISLNEEFTGFCCITESKLRKTFSSEIKAKSEKRQLTAEECLTKLKQQYNVNVSIRMVWLFTTLSVYSMSSMKKSSSPIG